MYGIEPLEADGTEAVMQKWCLARNSERALAVINDSVNGISVTEDAMEISLVRTAGYAAHPIGPRQILPHDRFMPHIDMGESTFDFCLIPEAVDKELPALAGQWNQKPVVVSYYSAIQGDRIDLFYESESDCEAFGRQMVKAYLLAE